MNIVRDTAYWAKRALLGLYGPADQDPEHDPVQELKREHEADVRQDEDASERADDQPRTP